QTSEPVLPGIPGTVIAIQGSGSAKLEAGDGIAPDWGMRFIKIEQSVTIPAWANQATVFVNGWRLSYLDSDHHVLALGSLIGRIQPVRGSPRTEEKVVSWTAMALLRDDNGDDGYDWTYNFTVLAWSDRNLDAIVDHGFVNACTPDGKTIFDNYFYFD